MSEHFTKVHYLDPETLHRIGDLELIAREAVEGLRVGSHRSPLKGFSTEFSHHRQYTKGDTIRDIDWRVYGRTERYYTKLYEAETNYDCYILVDASASMNYGSGVVNKLEYAKYLAAAMAYVVLKQRDSVGLSVFDSEVRAYVPPKSSMNIIVQIDRLLRGIKPVPRTTIARQLRDIATMIKRKSFVVVISDFFADVDDIMAGLDGLRFSGHNVIALHTLDPYEIAFPFKGTWQFDGLELEEPLTTQAERAKEDYLLNFNTYLSALRKGCGASQVDHTVVDTSRPLDAVLSEFFHRRESLGSAGGGRS